MWKNVVTPISNDLHTIGPSEIPLDCFGPSHLAIVSTTQMWEHLESSVLGVNRCDWHLAENDWKSPTISATFVTFPPFLMPKMLKKGSLRGAERLRTYPKTELA